MTLVELLLNFVVAFEDILFDKLDDENLFPFIIYELLFIVDDMLLSCLFNIFIYLSVLFLSFCEALSTRKKLFTTNLN